MTTTEGAGTGNSHLWSITPPPAGLPRLNTGRAYLEVLGVFGIFFAGSIAAAAFSLNGPLGDTSATTWSESIPAVISQMATTVACILLPLLLAARRGGGVRQLGLSVRGPGAIGWSRGVRVAAVALTALLGSSLVISLLATGKYPVGSRAISNLLLNLAHSLQAGPLEEIVVLGFVVTTLEQARRPLPEIVAVALVLRASYHIYYGTGVFGIFIWAAVFLWLFLRTRSLVPLIVVHSGWDVLAILSDQWRALSLLLILCWLLLLLVAGGLALEARARRREAAGPGRGQLPPQPPNDSAGWGPPVQGQRRR